jgi:hypothetical protein
LPFNFVEITAIVSRTTSSMSLPVVSMMTASAAA